tara:strand:- start:615 stop:941 length:327 start_codon:yes stop_codon:yes gene_type:complete
MTKRSITESDFNVITQGEYDDVPVENLQELVDSMADQLRSAKQVLRDKRLEGVNAAVTARREADEELAEELRKLGYLPTREFPSLSMMKLQAATGMRNSAIRYLHNLV